MKKHLHKLILFSATACLSACTAQEPLTDYVDPRIGTAHSRWFFFTPAAVPFGMAKLAPTTDGHLGNPNGWEAVGYDSRHTSIEGFANFHEFQVGGVVVAPTVGELQTVPGPLDNPDAGYRSRFDKKDEVARPGYYSVLLKDYGVKAELTATERVGFHRYTFPATEEANLIFNIGTRMGESGPVRDASVTYTDDGRIEGWVVTEPAYVDIYQKGATVTMYFSAVLDAEPAAWGAFSGEQTFAGERSRTGVGAGLYLRFDTRERQQVGLKIGLSYTSVENARLNLEKEAARKDFDRVRREANDTWEEALGRLRVEGGLHDDRVKFYTGLFHALLGRGLASDVNGAYPANDGTVGQIALDGAGKPEHHYYNTDAIWGAYWNLTQLWSIAYPEYYADWVASQLLVYKDAGWLGDGIACSKYVSGVGTNFTGLAIAAAYNCGIRNFDVALGYQAARKNELGSEGRPAGAGKLDVGKFVSQGYSPYLPELGMQTTPDGSGFAASHTLEYSFSAYAVAQMARQLGHEADYEQLKKLSGGWELLFDPETKYIRPRDRSGEFIADFDPYAAWAGFQEGNAVQYTYYVPHDIDRLVEMVGREEFNNRLDSTFLISRESVFGGGKTISQGYSPYLPELGMQTTPDGSGFAASHTLEYSFSAYAVAQMARQLGHEADYEQLKKLSGGWELLFDPETKYIRPRDRSGEFIADFDPYAAWAGFQEGNAVQYTYYVPHDIDRLVEMVGREEFNNRLDSTFLISRESVFGGGKTINAFAGVHAYYNHGNQPNLHISALFNFSGKPWLSQKWMRTICNEFYGTEEIHGYGYGQDEDQGQLGAWYVMASMGLFDAKGLTAPDPTFQIGSPLFDKVTIRLNPDYYTGKEFVIETTGNTPENYYIGSLELDGKPLQSVQLPFAEVVGGGTLRVNLAAEPNTQLNK